jgi:hypothetical protein
MQIANRKRTCWNGSVYCSINRTKCVQCGKGLDYVCPICGTKYIVIIEPEKLTAEERQKIINKTLPNTSP